MPSIVTTRPAPRRATLKSPVPAEAFRLPHYDCEMTDGDVRLRIYVPGVTASGVEITTRGPDLWVVARKSHLVRVNWSALQLERVSRDYRLHLRLGTGLDYEALHAELVDGTLALTLPRKARRATRPLAPPAPRRLKTTHPFQPRMMDTNRPD